MTVLIGLPRDGRATAAIHLGTLLARSLGEDVVVCTVVPQPWAPGLGRIDSEYQEFLDADAEAALERARELMPAGVSAEFTVARARSAAAGLLEVAERHGARLLALGSSAGSVLGRVAFGSVAERLLHSSPLPVALAPRGYRCRPVDRITDVTAAFGASDGADALVLAVAGVAARGGAGLRIASFAVRPRTPLTAGVGSRAEYSVLDVWAGEVEQAQQAVLEKVRRLPEPPDTVPPVIGRGADWAAALESIGWDDGSVLAVGSSTAGPLERVFIGSRSSKIVRHSPVPVVVLPRAAAESLAHLAATPGEVR
jgi:nucleotide-binding universal stress UspA family protein